MRDTFREPSTATVTDNAILFLRDGAHALPGRQARIHQDPPRDEAQFASLLPAVAPVLHYIENGENTPRPKVGIPKGPPYSSRGNRSFAPQAARTSMGTPPDPAWSRRSASRTDAAHSRSGSARSRSPSSGPRVRI